MSSVPWRTETGSIFMGVLSKLERRAKAFPVEGQGVSTLRFKSCSSAIRLIGWGAAVCAASLLADCGLFPIRPMSFVGTSVLEAAPKPPPIDSAFDGCGDAGSQPDYPLNRLKNRIDDGKYLRVDWKLIARLPWPTRVGYRFRNQWTESETRPVKRFEGAAVEVEGYAVTYKLEIPEPPNCYSTDPRNRDYHVWLSEHARGNQRKSIVVEITPRVRARHPGWTADRLQSLVASQAKIRVRGWLMLDQMHPESIGGSRTTLWEIHPIMQIDWRSPNGRWLSLDSAAAAP